MVTPRDDQFTPRNRSIVADRDGRCVASTAQDGESMPNKQSRDRKDRAHYPAEHRPSADTLQLGRAPPEPGAGQPSVRIDCWWLPRTDRAWRPVPTTGDPDP